MHALAPRLRQGAADLNCMLDGAQIQCLLDYLELLQKWNKVYNLTAVRDPQEMLTHHLFDCLAVIRPLQNYLQNYLQTVADRQTHPLRLLDVGSGAGLPGVVIAICCPGVMVHCVDTVAKKAAFIQQVASSLRISNLQGIHARVESLAEQYDVITSRAFAALPDFCRWSESALSAQGVWMAMKGKYPADEVAALPEFAEVFHVEQLQIPDLSVERCLVWMRRRRDCAPDQRKLG
ncbi:MAG: 16S rRNA (guanine(527)-N(7))-methyltransferase RsmG [Rhodoferax sp.]|nr:16S rRNA (guanine(527)-N(7))-methyltransferase RsmG [Rhodoferax sp.]